jgi:hypothetical protein
LIIKDYKLVRWPPASPRVDDDYEEEEEEGGGGDDDDDDDLCYKENVWTVQ